MVGAPLSVAGRSAVLLTVLAITFNVIGPVCANVIQLLQLTFEIGLQSSAVVTLKGSQLVDLLLQHVTLASERFQHGGLLLLSLGKHARGTLARLGDHLLVPRAGLGDQRVVLGLTGREELGMF